MFIFVYEYFIRVRLMWKSIYKFRSSRSIEGNACANNFIIFVIRLFDIYNDITILILKVNYFFVYCSNSCKIFYYRHGIIIVLKLSRN